MRFFFFYNITSKIYQIWTNTLEPRNFWENSQYQRHKIQWLSREASKYAKFMDEIVCHSNFINKPLQHVIEYEKKQQIHAKTKNSVEMCLMKVSKQFKS